MKMGTIQLDKEKNFFPGNIAVTSKKGNWSYSFLKLKSFQYK